MKHLLSLTLIAGLGLGLVPRPTAAEPLVDLARQSFTNAERTEAGQVFSFDMGTRRVNWNRARWSIIEFDEARDLSRFGGVEVTLATEQPRSDAVVALAVREAGRSWHYHPAAGRLTKPQTTTLARFSDFATPWYMAPPRGTFVDPDGRLDPENIDAVAIGVVNPLGVGEVGFTLTGLNLVELAPERPDEPVRIHVTGKLLDVNDTQSIPAGLFGGYHLPTGSYERYRLGMRRNLIGGQAIGGNPQFGDEVTHMLLNCIGERVNPSPRQTHADWEQRSKDLARQFVERAREADQPLYVEYWNEPYLNWANRNRINFNPAHYNLDEAEEGGIVRIRHDGEKVPHLRWTQDYDAPPWNWDSRRNWRRGRDETGRVWSTHAQPYFYRGPNRRAGYYPETHPPEDVADGEQYTVEVGDRELTLTAFTPWHIYDETQFTFWSGRGMQMLYIEPLLAFANTLKQEMPEATFIAGWDFRPSEDHWAAWDIVYKDTIDKAIDVLDGVADHDYGGDPLRMAANYETVTAYGVIEHDKWLYHYNTETAMGGDPQAYPEAEGLSSGARMDRQKFRWTTAKLLHALQYVPDKARAFAWFGRGGGWFSHGGEGVALDMLINLRGRLVQVEHEDPDLFIVAAIDGADPQNPRPDNLPDRQELVIAIYNAALEARPIDLTLAPPAGTTAATPKLLQSMLEQTAPEGRRVEGGIDRNGPGYRIQRELPERSLLVVTVPLEGTVADEAPAQVRHTQSFAPIMIEPVAHGEPVATSVQIDEEALGNAGRAWVRVVVERLGEDEGTLVLNGVQHPLPRAVTPETTPWIRQFAIDPAILKAGENELTFRVNGAEHPGFLLCSASVIIEHPTGR